MTTTTHTTTTKKAIAIYPDKRVEEVEIPDNGLETLQGIVAGMIEAVGLSDGGTMYVNEEFRYRFGPEDFNSIAGDVAGLGGRPVLMLSGILGPVVVLGPLDDEGNDTDITDIARRWIMRVGREAGAIRVTRPEPPTTHHDPVDAVIHATDDVLDKAAALADGLTYGDSSTFKAGYTQENAALAAAEMTQGRVTAAEIGEHLGWAPENWITVRLDRQPDDKFTGDGTGITINPTFLEDRS